jgi:uncharacterized protein (DUF736 family)
MEQKENTGSMFPNKFKTEDKHPHLKGQATIDGHLYDVAGWSKLDKNGNKWLSLAFSEPKEQAESTTAQVDDFPF